MIISGMQGKLATWANEDGGRRLDRLLRLIANRSWLQEAARMVLSSKGAHTAGIDGVDKRVMQECLEQQLETIACPMDSGLSAACIMRCAP